MGSEDERWNAFRSHKRAATEQPSLTQWMVTALQAAKLLIFIASSFFLTVGAVMSKLLVVLVATNIQDHPHTATDSFTRKCSRDGAPRSRRAVAGMFLCLALVQCIPDTISLIQCCLRVYKGTRAGRVRIVIVLLEGLRALGLSLLVFCVFPQLDPARCVLLTACLPLVSVLQHLMGSMSIAARPAPRFLSRMVRSALTVPHFVMAMIVVSGTYLWAVMDVPFKAKAALPIGLLAASLGFWESWVGPNHDGTPFHHLYQIKYGVRKLNPSTRAAQCIVRMMCIVSVMSASSHGIVKSHYFWRALTSYSMDFMETRLILLAVALCILHCMLRGCARFLAALDMRVLSFLHPMTIGPPILYFLLRYVCNNAVCSAAKTLSSLSLRWSCDGWTPRPFDDWYLCMVWLIVGTYRAWTYVTQRTFDKTDEVIDSMSPATNAFCVEQSLVVFQHSLTKMECLAEADNDPCEVGESALRNAEIDRTLTLYICATMWHETTVEMTQMLRSILKLDEEHSRRLGNKKTDQLRFKLEGHIYFDDAWTDEESNGNVKRVPNEFFKTFFVLLNEMTGEKPDVFGQMTSRVLVQTPYGGRVVIRLPAGTLLFVHLKDKKLIRHKKRWSQVMYMYYLLGHRIMDSPMSIEDRQQLADSTFVLAIDGDSKFEPEAVVRLLALMEQKSDIGCACGRIHPIGSGIMVWYQKFEYAIAHWFQKAAEHVFGCVLCAPGCFSLFRASALMDDNIMHKYTTTAEQPRHFVQYDQGEDRWLSTLMLKQGYRIEYAAASDAETYAPEGFEEFFNQRRRWTPSSIANTVDLLTDYKRACQNNESISTTYIAYQFLVIAFSMLGPAIIFSMVVFAQVAAFGTDSAKMMVWNGVPILLFIFLCFTTESNTQLFYAKIMSIVYAFVMLAVLIATSSQIVLETVVSPTSMFIVAMVVIFLLAACMHPREFTNIIYGTVFFLMIPSTYIFLSLYSLINLNVINWGTREAVAKATGKVESRSPMERWIQLIGDTVTKLFRKMFSKKDPAVNTLKMKLDKMERQIERIKQGELGEDELTKEKCIGTEAASEGVLDGVPKLIRESNKYAWMHVDYLKMCERGRLKAAEDKFWSQLISFYLKPIESSPAAQIEVASGLVSLRNNIAFSIILVNALLALAIWLIQKHKNVLSIKWTPFDGFKWTKMNEMTGQFEETQDPLKIDPLGMGIIIFLLGILIVQTIGMIIHRFNTLIGAFQEVRYAHEVSATQTKMSEQDDRILTAARQMIGSSHYPAAHATDGYTRLPSSISGDGNVLYKLQRARLAERMKRGALDEQE